MIFKWAYESELIERPVRFGPDFLGARKRLIRQHKAETGQKLFSRKELRTILESSKSDMKAMVLLGINGGLGNTDVASLTLSSVDLGSGFLIYPRPKTGISRRIPLWSETCAALELTYDKRPQPRAEFESVVFLTKNGTPLLNVWKDGNRTDQITVRFRRLLKALGLYRKGKGFYWLRHTFQTIGDEARDAVATSAIMGHADASMAGQYRETISDERLRRVTDHVHDWLFGDSE